MKSLSNLKPIIFCILLVAISASTQAAIFADYGFGGSDLDPDDTDLDTTATSLSIGAGLSFDRFENRGFWVQSNSGPSAYVFTGGEDATVLDNDFIAFTLTPVGGVNLDFTSMTFATRAANTTVSVASSADSYSSVIGSSSASGGWTVDTISLTPMAVVSSPVEFRLYFSDSSGDVIIDDIQLNGVVTAIPEPSTIALLGLAGLAGFFFLRRR
jgi:hypothetical protein